MKIKFFNFELELSDEEMMTLWRSCKERNKDLTFEQFLSNIPKLFLSNGIDRKRFLNFLMFSSLGITILAYMFLVIISKISPPDSIAWIVYVMTIIFIFLSLFSFSVAIILKIGDHFLNK